MLNTQIWKDFISLFYPRICFVCDNALVSEEAFVCTHCLLDIPKFDITGPDADLLKNRFIVYDSVQHAWPLMEYYKNGPAPKLLYKIKYDNQTELAKYMGVMLGYELKKHFGEKLNQYDMILPIPIHKSKMATRGYNQSDFIAEGLAATLQVSYDSENLIRTKKTSTQTRKTKLERWQNVDSIYKMLDPAKVEDKSVILLDDVVTTGATIGTAIDLLEECGVKNVFVACLATER